MADLNVDLNYFTHPKTKRLIGLLGRGSEVLPIRLWCHCGAHHSETGTLAGYSPQEIEALAEWWGKPGAMLQALLKVGFVHETADGYQIHDWEEHQGHIHAFKLKGQAMAKTRWDKVRDAARNAASIATSNASTVPTNQPTNQASNRVGTRAESGVSDDETEFMLLCKVVFPKDEMAANGGLWRNRYRDKPAKAWRVLNDTAETIKNRPAEIKGSIGAFATDLWKRFA